MKIRFSSRKKTDHMKNAYIVIMIIIVCIIAVIFSGIFKFRSNYDDKQTMALKDAIYDSLITCYSLEGRYPQDLEHLSEKYGLVLDRNKYAFRYELIGSNIFPEYDVVKLIDGNKKGSSFIYQEGDGS